MTPDQRETIANAAAMLDGMAFELHRAHSIPPHGVIPEPEVAAEYMRIRRVVLELYDIANEPNAGSNGPSGVAAKVRVD